MLRATRGFDKWYTSRQASPYTKLQKQVDFNYCPSSPRYVQSHPSNPQDVVPKKLACDIIWVWRYSGERAVTLQIANPSITRTIGVCIFRRKHNKRASWGFNRLNSRAKEEDNINTVIALKKTESLPGLFQRFWKQRGQNWRRGGWCAIRTLQKCRIRNRRSMFCRNLNSQPAKLTIRKR